MDRRDFNGLLCGAGACLLPTPLSANLEPDRDRSLLIESRIALRLTTGQFLVTWLLMISAGRMLGLDLRQEVPQFKEDRANLGGLPILGGLLRPPLGRQFQAALFFAPVVLLGKMLVLVPQADDAPAPRKVVIAHRDLSWEPPGRPREVAMKGVPAVPDLLGLPPIGRAFLKPGAKRELLVVIRPSVVREPDS